MAEITRLHTGARMSQAVIHNGTVYLAGQVGNPDEGVAEQMRTCLARVDQMLAEAGTDKTRILSAQIWLSDMANFKAVNAEWDAWVPEGHAPARAAGESALAAPEYLVEVLVIAALP